MRRRGGGERYDFVRYIFSAVFVIFAILGFGYGHSAHTELTRLRSENHNQAVDLDELRNKLKIIQASVGHKNRVIADLSARLNMSAKGAHDLVDRHRVFYE